MPKWAIKMWNEPGDKVLVTFALTGAMAWYVSAVLAATFAFYWILQHVRIVLI